MLGFKALVWHAVDTKGRRRDWALIEAALTPQNGGAGGIRTHYMVGSALFPPEESRERHDERDGQPRNSC